MDEFPVATTPAPGVMAVDWEERGPSLPRRANRRSLTDPIEIKEGMVFTLETYAPAKDGRSAARIEEEIVVTSEGAKVITLFPCEELMVANEY